MALGVAFALLAGLVWGLVFVAPLLLPQYSAALLTCGRYLAFGLIALPLGWLDRQRLRQFSRQDWREALKLSAVGNFLYYLCLSAAIQRAGGPLPTMIIGTLPVVIAITSNLRDAQRDGRLPWLKLLPSLALIAAGIGCVNQVELQHLREQAGGFDALRYGSGVLLAVGAVVCWTWYPIRNADWLRHHADRSPRTWATAQGLMTLPLAVIGYAGLWLWSANGSEGVTGMPMPWGPAPERYLVIMLALGLLSSWVGTLCWNEASQRVPTALAGQLIVFETLSALAYALVLRGQWPDGVTLTGIALLMVGVLQALRIRPEAVSH